MGAGLGETAEGRQNYVAYGLVEQGRVAELNRVSYGWWRIDTATSHSSLERMTTLPRWKRDQLRSNLNRNCQTLPCDDVTSNSRSQTNCVVYGVASNPW